MNDLLKLGKKLFPLNRSITGEGSLKTLKIIKKKIPKLKIKYFKCNSKVFDWRIPSEWVIKKAYIADKFGKKIIDFKNNNLHLVSYSENVNQKINRDLLFKKIYTNKILKDAIPYVTSYYEKNWGFCMTEKQKQIILKKYKKSDKFHVFIDSSFKKNGKMHYGELIVPGKSKKEILISTYVCHPSMANNELSGPLISVALIKHFLKRFNEKTLRFIFVSETIGSIAYIKHNFSKLKKNILGGYVLSCLGDNRNHSFVESKYGNSVSDLALKKAYKRFSIKFQKFSFLKRGSDERQFNSPKINLGLVSVSRSKFGTYKEYHTSLDKFGSVVTKKGLEGGYKVVREAIYNILNFSGKNKLRQIKMKKGYPLTKIICEPQLSRRNIIRNISNQSIGYNKKKDEFRRNLLNFLQYSDGTNEIKEISKKIKLNLKLTKKINRFCMTNKLV